MQLNAVKYLGKNDMFDFGMIYYFLKIENIVLVAFSQFKINNIIDKIGGRSRNAFIRIKNSVVFEQFYSDLTEINDKMSKIEKSKLISKCIVSKTSVLKKFLISEFIIENEHE
jgi:uncharacterized protein YlbG (UPF0298 family)